MTYDPIHHFNEISICGNFELFFTLWKSLHLGYDKLMLTDTIMFSSHTDVLMGVIVKLKWWQVNITGQTHSTVQLTNEPIHHYDENHYDEISQIYPMQLSIPKNGELHFLH